MQRIIIQTASESSFLADDKHIDSKGAHSTVLGKSRNVTKSLHEFMCY